MVDGDAYARGQPGLDRIELSEDRVGNLEGGLVAHAVYVNHHRGLAVIGDVTVRVGEAVVNRRDLPQSQFAAVGRGDDGDLRKLAAVVAALLHAKQYLAAFRFDPAAGRVHGGIAKPVGHDVQRQAVAAQVFLGDIYADLQGRHPGYLDIRDAGVIEQLVANLFGQFVQHRVAHVAVEHQGKHLVFVRGDADLRFLGVLGERGNAVHLALDVLGELLHIGPEQEFHGHRAGAFLCHRGYLINAVETADSLFCGQDHPVLNFLRAGARI